MSFAQTTTHNDGHGGSTATGPVRSQSTARVDSVSRPRELLREHWGPHMRPAWQCVEHFRQTQTTDRTWPHWCFLPHALWVDAVSLVLRPEYGVLAHDLAVVAGTLGAWRITQGIYSFDPTLYDAVRETDISGPLPTEVLTCLPEWCVYVSTPHVLVGDQPVHGFFARLDFCLESGAKALHLALDFPDTLETSTIPLDDSPIESGLDFAFQSNVRTISDSGVVYKQARNPAEHKKAVRAALSLLLYICDENADWGAAAVRPTNPPATKTKRGLRFFPADRPTVWNVGVRVGAELRKRYAQLEADAANDGDRTHARPRAHYRRAHWHRYYVGPVGSSSRRLVPRWVHPALVNAASPDELPATIRPVVSANDDATAADTGAKAAGEASKVKAGGR